MWKKVIALLVAAGLIAGLAYAVLDRDREFRINPRAKLVPEDTYAITMWFAKPLIPDVGTLVEEVEQVVAEFTVKFSNITVETYFIPELQVEAKLAQAILDGTPPDVYINPLTAQNYYGELQVPLGMYLTKEELATWEPAVRMQLSSEGQVCALPVAFYSRVFMANPERLPNAAQVASDGWTWEQFYADIENATAKNKPGLAITNNGTPLLQAIAASLGKPAPCDDQGKLLWSESDIATMADIWQKLSSIPGLEKVNAINEDCLAQFLQAKAALIGPLNPQLTRWLLKVATTRGLAPLLLPIPSGTAAQFADLSATSVVVFRQSQYLGHSHTRAAAELALYLSMGLGDSMNKHLGIISASGATDGLAYSRVERASATPYAYGPQPGLTTQHWVEVISPLWQEYIAKRLSAPEFTTKLYDKLMALTSTTQ